MAWLTGYSKRRKLTIDHDDIGSTLANFPVLVYLSSSSGIGSTDVTSIFDALESDDNRKKIAITTSDGQTECYVEIEKWDHANEKAWLWVKVPSAAHDTDTELYIYYDKTHADNDTYVGDPGESPAQSVWDDGTDNFYKAVWHLPETTGNNDLVIKNTATYDAFGITVKTGENTFIHFTRMGTTHISDKGKIVGLPYDASTHTWGDYYDVFTDASYDCRNVAGGVIGTHIFIFFVRYELGVGFHDIGYIKSTDLTGTSWGSYTTINTGMTVFSPYGSLIEANGVHYQTFYGWGSPPPYEMKLFKSTDDGDNWTVGATIYSGTTHYAEPAGAYIGNDKLIVLCRNVAGEHAHQFRSSDNGDTWASAGETNLGSGTGQVVCNLQVEGDRLLVVFGDSTTYFLWVSDSPHSVVFTSQDLYNTEMALTATYDDLNHAYPSAQYWKDGIWIIVFSRGAGGNDQDSAVLQFHRVINSTQYRNNDGHGVNLIPAVQEDGQADGAYHLDGADQLSRSPDDTTIAGLSPMTIELWLKHDGAMTGNEGLISRDYRVSGNDCEWVLAVWNSSGAGWLFLYLFSGGNGSANYLTGWSSVVNLGDGNLHHVVATWDGVNATGHIKFYIDKVERALNVYDLKDGTGYIPHDSNANTEIGRYGENNMTCWDGIIDEVRVSKTCRSADYVTATYESEVDDLITFGSEEAAALTVGQIIIIH